MSPSSARGPPRARCSSASPGCPATRSPCARGRGHPRRRRRASAPVAALAGARRGRTAGAARRRSPGPRSCAPTRRSASSTRWSRERRLPRRRARASASSARAGRAPAGRRGRAARAGRRAPAPCPAAATRGSVETLRAAARRRCARARPTAPSPTCDGRWPSRRDAEQPPRARLELGIAEALTSGPAAAEHLRAAYERLRRPDARGRIATVLGPGAALHRLAAEAGGARPRRGPSCPRTRPTWRCACRRSCIGVDLRSRGRRGAARARRRAPATGLGADMLAAVEALDWACAAAAPSVASRSRWRPSQRRPGRRGQRVGPTAAR